MNKMPIEDTEWQRKEWNICFLSQITNNLHILFEIKSHFDLWLVALHANDIEFLFQIPIDIHLNK